MKQEAETVHFNQHWDENNPMYRDIFTAAITGICANPNFFGHQGDARAAVDFANEIVLAAIYGKSYTPPYEREGANNVPF